MRPSEEATIIINIEKILKDIEKNPELLIISIQGYIFINLLIFELIICIVKDNLFLKIL